MIELLHQLLGLLLVSLVGFVPSLQAWAGSIAQWERPCQVCSSLARSDVAPIAA